MSISDYRAGTHWHSLETLSNALGFCPRHIKRGTRILEQLDIINKKQRGFNKSNLYCLNFSTLQDAQFYCTSCQNVPLSSLSKREDSINTFQSKVSRTQSHNELFELTYDWSPTMYTINNIEKYLGLDYTRRDSERRSWIAYTLKRADGKKVYLTQKQANAMYYHFCKTTKAKEVEYISKGKEFMTMEQRRNYHESKCYPEPKAVQRYERHTENLSVDLRLLAIKRPYASNSGDNWELEAQQLLYQDAWKQGLTSEQIALFENHKRE